MGLDIHTLALVLGLSYILQVLVLFVQYMLNRAIKGLGYWTMGNALAVLGYIATYLRDNPTVGLIAIVSNNIFFVLSIALTYVGVLIFLRRPVKHIIIIAFCAAVILIAFYFTYFNYNFAVRVVNIAFAIAVFSFLISYSFFRNRSYYITFSANLLSFLFLLFGTFHIIRAAATIISPIDSTSSPNLLQTTNYLVSLVTSTLWTFGSIIMINQKLQRTRIQDELLLHVASRLLSSEEPQTIIDEVSLKTMNYLGCHVFFNFLVDPGEGRLFLNAYAGIPVDEAKRIQWLDYGVAVCGCAALEGCKIIAENIPETPDKRTDLVKSYGVKAYACHPIVVENKTIGTISFGTRSKISFSEDELAVMKTVADHIAIAMHRLIARKELQESEERYRNLSKKLVNVDLRQSEDRFYKAFHLSPAMMNIQSIEDGCIIDVNETWLKVFGFTRKEVIGLNSKDLNLYIDPYQRVEIFRHLNEFGLISNFELQNYNKKRESITILSSAEIVELHGQRCYLWHEVDITERKRMEKEISRLDRLNLIGEMAAGIGHEIRNPMTTVRGFLQLMTEDPRFIDGKNHFDLMINELDRANSIITEFLSLAKNKVTNFEVVDINKVLINLSPLLLADSNKSEKEICLDFGAIPYIKADEKEFRQLLLNLVRNGLDAMLPGGVLYLRTYFTGNNVVLEIQDSGSGIPQEIIDKLGQPFVTTKENGTGLGLSVCYSICQRHNAKLEYKTGPIGTTFYVKFLVA